MTYVHIGERWRAVDRSIKTRLLTPTLVGPAVHTVRSSPHSLLILFSPLPQSCRLIPKFHYCFSTLMPIMKGLILGRGAWKSCKVKHHESHLNGVFNAFKEMIPGA